MQSLKFSLYFFVLYMAHLTINFCSLAIKYHSALQSTFIRWCIKYNSDLCLFAYDNYWITILALSKKKILLYLFIFPLKIPHCLWKSNLPLLNKWKTLFHSTFCFHFISSYLLISFIILKIIIIGFCDDVILETFSSCVILALSLSLNSARCCVLLASCRHCCCECVWENFTFLLNLCEFWSLILNDTYTQMVLWGVERKREKEKKNKKGTTQTHKRKLFISWNEKKNIRKGSTRNENDEVEEDRKGGNFKRKNYVRVSETEYGNTKSD